MSDVDFRSILRKPYFVPETKNIDSLFVELQTEKQLISESHNAETEYPASTVEGIHEGDRCEVSPGGRRGTVKWVGVLENNSVSKGGYWVGVVLDEPTGRNNGMPCEAR